MVAWWGCGVAQTELFMIHVQFLRKLHCSFPFFLWTIKWVQSRQALQISGVLCQLKTEISLKIKRDRLLQDLDRRSWIWLVPGGESDDSDEPLHCSVSILNLNAQMIVVSGKTGSYFECSLMHSSSNEALTEKHKRTKIGPLTVTDAQSQMTKRLHQNPL